MPAKVILNPYAGRWKAKELMVEVESALQSAGVAYDLSITERPGHGTELAKQAVRDGFSPIIAAGGDGSISEVVNGIVQVSRQMELDHWATLGILPLGTANDLLINLGLPQNLQEAAGVIAKGVTRRIDLGAVRWDNAPDWRYFDNNSAIGLEPTITLIQQRIKWLKGTPRYLFSALMGIAQNPYWHVEIEWEGGSYKGPANLVTIGNNPLTGGLFYMTPHASPFDGKLTFVYGYMRTRLQTLRLFPRTMKRGEGSYVEHQDIHEVHSPWLRIHTTATPLHADGEIQSIRAQDIEYKVLPNQLAVLVS